MNINWQDVFYITASLAMIVFLVSSIWLIRLFFITSKIINNFAKKLHRWGIIVDDIKYFEEEVKLKISKFLLKILNKKNKNEKR